MYGTLKKSLVKFTHQKFEENESEFNKMELLTDLDAISFANQGLQAS